MMRLNLFAIIFGALARYVLTADSPCNPVNGTCDPVPGFVQNYEVDFTKLEIIPSSDWVTADYEGQYLHVGSNGIEFRLEQYDNAPYIWTSKYIHYGKVSVTLRTAPGVGIVSSAVLLSDDLDEIDWEFSGNDFSKSVPTVQTNYYGKGVTGSWDRGTQPAVAYNMTESLSTYTLDWKPDFLTWSINETIIRTLYAKDCDSADHQYPQTPARFHLGVWDAGAPSLPWYTKVWAGGETDLKGFPYSMFVQRVSIQPYKFCESYSYSDLSGSSESVNCLNSTIASSDSTTAARVSYTASSETTSLPTSSCTTSAPERTQPGTLDGCAQYYMVKSGDDCETIATSQKVNSDDIKAWNPQVGEQCYNLWLNYYICVSPPGVCNGTMSSVFLGTSSQGTTAPVRTSPGSVSSTIPSLTTSISTSLNSTLSVSSKPETSQGSASTTTNGVATSETSSTSSARPVSSTTEPSTLSLSKSSPTGRDSSPVSHATTSIATQTTVLSCPSSNGTTYTASTGVQFTVECNIDHVSGDMAFIYVSGHDAFRSCIEKCATTSGCVDVSLSGTACYLKKTLGSVVPSSVVWGAKLKNLTTPVAIIPTVVPYVLGYGSLGCYSEKQPLGRALDFVYVDDTMTIERCATHALGEGAIFFGVEYGRECWYGKKWAEDEVVQLGQRECGFPCPGSGLECCGAGDAMQMYKRTKGAASAMPKKKRTESPVQRNWFGLRVR